VAKVKVVGTGLDQNLNGTNFNNTASETIFQFGTFSVTSNFSGRIPIDYTNTLDSFVRPVTLETLGVTDVQSAVLHQYQVNAVLNLDKSNLNTFVRFGSTYEFFRVTIQEIILKYPGSLYCNSNIILGGNPTILNFNYNVITDESLIQIPSACIANTFGLVFNMGNLSQPNDMVIRNLNLSYEKYVIWSKYDPNNAYPLIGFTGDTSGIPYVWVKTQGNPFLFNTGMTNKLDFHIKPNNFVFEEFRALLTSYEQYIVSQRQFTSGFQFTINEPSLLDDGSVVYSTTSMLWTTTDGYNIDISTTPYQKFLTSMLAIGAKYDAVKTDLIARFLTPASIKTYDLTEDGKMTKLLRVYGWEFDQLRKFIDSLVNINTVTYDKLNNIPDQLVSNLARTFGWDYFTLVNEGELVDNFLSIDSTERVLGTDLMPAEVNIELWRRILINTNYLWKSKGTRQAIKSIFLLIGIPEPFINITEYVYTVQGKINPNTVPLTQADFPNNSLPYDNSGYPVAPLESPAFYFQISGDTDSGQAYMDNFRQAGFNLMRTVDNKKSWIQTGATTRIHYSTPQYNQADSKLVLNTKEVDVALDTARGIEYDVYTYIEKDFAANSSGYTLPFSYVNISLPVTGTALSGQTEFTLPFNANKVGGYLEVRYNGILLTPNKYYDETGIHDAPTPPFDVPVPAYDYTYSKITNKIYLVRGSAINQGNQRDVIQATFVYSGGTHPVTGITVQYIVARIKPTLTQLGTYIPLPGYPRGDVQVTMNGIAMTKGTPQFVADYIVDPANSVGGLNNIIIQNPEVIAYLASIQNQSVVVAYLEVSGSNDINARSEVQRVDSFNTSKIYFNVSANKYVYKMNYKANSASDVKVLVDGIALEPGMDYDINPMNLFEIFLPRGINYGSVISVYYLVGGSAYFTPIVHDSFGVGDISKLSFLEFIELIQRRLINAKTRKTISDFKGGWYPTLLNVYIQYLIRGQLPYNDPLHSNGYTFENLYPFLSKYNAFFQRFVDELLSATIILKQGGLLVRNTVFTKQKFMYRRGVNLYSGNSTTMDMRGMPMVHYLGDDGSTFLINQEINAPPPPVDPTLFVETTAGSPGIGSINNFGGNNISISTGLNTITEYGVKYSTSPTGPWQKVFELGAPITNSYTMSASPSPLTPNTLYYYFAYIQSGIYSASGATLQATTLAVPIVPSLETLAGTSTQTTISTGGINVIGGNSANWYGMQFRISGAWSTTPLVAGPIIGSTYSYIINGLVANTTYEYRSYMVIGGVEYYGNVLTLATAQITPVAPTVTTNTITSIAQTTATGGGNVTDAGTQPVTARGIAWGVSSGPTIAGSHTVDGSGTGAFVSSMTGLAPNTTYYVRAYATSAVGTSYGNEVSFITPATPQVYFGSVNNIQQSGIMAADNATTQTFTITFKYFVSATCGNEYSGGYNQSQAQFEMSTDGVNFGMIDAVSCDVNPPQSGGYAEATGTTTVTVAATDIAKIRFRGNWSWSTGFSDSSDGGFWVEIISVVANIGGVTIKCNNRLQGSGTDFTPTLDCSI
jgi:hypothetical protein